MRFFQLLHEPSDLRLLDRGEASPAREFSVLVARWRRRLSACRLGSFPAGLGASFHCLLRAQDKTCRINLAVGTRPPSGGTASDNQLTGTPPSSPITRAGCCA